MNTEQITNAAKYMLMVVMIILTISYQISTWMMIISGFVDMNGACMLRYNQDDSGALTQNAVVTAKSVTINANANYNSLKNPNYTPSSNNGSRTPQIEFMPDPSTYGKWYNAGPIVNAQSFGIKVEGTVSLCKSYLPAYNIQDGSSTIATASPAGNTGGPPAPIPVPRVGDPAYLGLRIPANATTWRNLVEVTAGDKVQVLVAPSVIDNDIGTNYALGAIDSVTDFTNITMLDGISGKKTTGVNCSSSVSSGLDPLCGRISIYSGQYINGCQPVVNVTCPSDVGSVWTTGYSDAASDSCRCPVTTNVANRSCDTPSKCLGYNCRSVSPSITTTYTPTYGDMPLNYDPAGSLTFASSTNAGSYIQNYSNVSCIDANSDARIKSLAANYKYWLTNGDGLMAQYADPTAAPGSIGVTDTGAGTLVANGTPSMQSTQKPLGQIIFDTTANGVTSNNIGARGSAMLQLGYINTGDSSQNRGGYLLYFQHTKCSRTNGQSATDTYKDRGKIYYILLPAQYDMNNLPSDVNIGNYINGFLDYSSSSIYTITVDPHQLLHNGTLNLWLIVNNDPNDYKDSVGEYKLTFSTTEKVGVFSATVLLPLFGKVYKVINESGGKVFQNLTCYNGDPGKCVDFFMYIRVLLTVYIMLFGFNFAMGRSNLNQMEFLTHIFKILTIGGLINGSTFEFCNSYIFPVIQNYSAQLIANFGGYSSNNPFTYLDEALNRILLNKMTLLQMLSLISGGLTGIVMFLMTGVGVMIFLTTALKAVATYIFAQLMVAFLIGMGPIFLTFMLFSPTRKYFQNWINALFRYSIEPVIVVVGLAVFTKLFIVYVDNVLGFSVCFKCAIPIQIPSVIDAFIPGFPPALKDIVLFCLYWFAPWGVDMRLGTISLGIPDVIGLSLVAFMCHTYVELASGIVTNLTGNMGPSASSMGAAAASEMMDPGAGWRSEREVMSFQQKFKMARKEFKEWDDKSGFTKGIKDKFGEYKTQATNELAKQTKPIAEAFKPVTDKYNQATQAVDAKLAEAKAKLSEGAERIKGKLVEGVRDITDNLQLTKRKIGDGSLPSVDAEAGSGADSKSVTPTAGSSSTSSGSATATSGTGVGGMAARVAGAGNVSSTVASDAGSTSVPPAASEVSTSGTPSDKTEASKLTPEQVAEKEAKAKQEARAKILKEVGERQAKEEAELAKRSGGQVQRPGIGVGSGGAGSTTPPVGADKPSRGDIGAMGSGDDGAGGASGEET